LIALKSSLMPRGTSKCLIISFLISWLESTIRAIPSFLDTLLTLKLWKKLTCHLKLMLKTNIVLSVCIFSTMIITNKRNKLLETSKCMFLLQTRTQMRLITFVLMLM
jgi:hypothetical protein